MRDDREQPDITPLLARAAAGDQRAWRELVALYAPRIFAMVQSRCRNHATSEEVTQAVLATVAIKLTTGDYSEQGKFEAWLFRITMNRVRDLVRRAKVRTHESLGDSADAVPDAQAASRAVPADPDPQIHALRDALTHLSEADREVIELRHHANLSFKQIADLLEEPLGTLLARHHRALRKLREVMETAISNTPRALGPVGTPSGDQPPGIDRQAGQGQPARRSERGIVG